MCGTPAGSRVWSWITTHLPPHLSDFGLREDVTLFIHSQWPLPQPVFVAYRVFLAGYTLAWLIMSIVNAGLTTGLGGFFIFLTNWTYIVLSLYLVTACISTAYASYRSRRPTSDENQNKPDSTAGTEHQPDGNDTGNSYALAPSAPDAETSHDGAGNTPAAPISYLPVYFKITWVLLTVCLSFSPIISIIYWAFIFDPAFVYANQGGAYGVALTVHRHAFNTVFAYLDLVVSAIPIRFWHFVYPCAYGVLYVFFSLIYYWAGGLNPYIEGEPAIYPMLLDWTTPGRTCLIILGFILVIIVLHSIAFGCYKLRMHIAARFQILTRSRENSQTLRNENRVGDDDRVTDVV